MPCEVRPADLFALKVGYAVGDEPQRVVTVEIVEGGQCVGKQLVPGAALDGIRVGELAGRLEIVDPVVEQPEPPGLQTVGRRLGPQLDEIRIVAQETQRPSQQLIPIA